MILVYDSFTGNTERFIKKLNIKNKIVKISENLIVDESYILVTYTTGIGQVPNSTLSFLDKNYSFIKGVASSGNRNWGSLFAKSADIISSKYNIPIIHKFELSGTKKDIKEFLMECEKNGLYSTE